MPPTAGFVAATIVWQYGFGFIVPLFLLAAVGLWITLPTRSSTSTPITETFSLESVATMLRQRIVVHAVLLLVLWGAVMQAFIGFYPTYPIDVKGLPTHIAAGLFGLFFALGSIIKPLSGRAYDRVGVRYPLLIMMSITVVTLAVLPFSTDRWSFVVITVLASTLLGYETIIISNLTEMLPDGTRGTGLGSLRTICITLGALSPVLFGAVANRGYFDEAFFGIALLTVIIVFLIQYYVDY